MAETQSTERTRKPKRRLYGRVISDKMSKTIVVGVDRAFKHSVYEKVVRHQVKYKAHDENNEAKVGDRVEIIETRPISKDKRWRVRRIVEKAKI